MSKIQRKSRLFAGTFEQYLKVAYSPYVDQKYALPDKQQAEVMAKQLHRLGFVVQPRTNCSCVTHLRKGLKTSERSRDMCCIPTKFMVQKSFREDRKSVWN